MFAKFTICIDLAQKKGEDDHRKGEEMRQAAMMSMFQYLHFKYTILISQFYRHAGRSSTPTTSSVDLDDNDEADEDANGSSSKKMKLSKGNRACGSLHVSGDSLSLSLSLSLPLPPSLPPSLPPILCLGKEILSTAELLHEKFKSKANMKEKELEVKKMELELQQKKWRLEEEERKKRLELDTEEMRLEAEERRAMIELLKKLT